MNSSYLKTVFVLLVSCFFATSQTRPPGAPTPAAPPDYVLFHAFFTHVERLEAHADSLKSARKDDSAARDFIKSRAKLTTGEAQQLKSTAKRCLADHRANSAQGTAAIQALKAQYPATKASKLPPQAAKQLRDLQTAREKIITDCMQGLRASMGSERFQQLRDFAVAIESPHISQSVPNVAPAQAK